MTVWTMDIQKKRETVSVWFLRDILLTKQYFTKYFRKYAHCTEQKQQHKLSFFDLISSLQSFDLIFVLRFGNSWLQVFHCLLCYFNFVGNFSVRFSVVISFLISVWSPSFKLSDNCFVSDIFHLIVVRDVKQSENLPQLSSCLIIVVLQTDFVSDICYLLVAAMLGEIETSLDFQVVSLLAALHLLPGLPHPGCHQMMLNHHNFYHHSGLAHHGDDNQPALLPPLEVALWSKVVSPPHHL